MFSSHRSVHGQLMNIPDKTIVSDGQTDKEKPFFPEHY